MAINARLTRLDPQGSPYLYVLPFFLLFGVFGLFPLIYTGYVSFNDWNLLDGGAHQWVGLANYREMLQDSYFWNSLGNTLSIWVLSTVPQLLAALGIAHLLNHKLRARTSLRMGVLLPNITSIVAVTIVFSQIFGRDFGMVNWVLGLLHVGPVDWQAHSWTSHLAISSIVIWRWTGYNALIYLASMQAIPHDLYEAAELDGASSGQQFRRITVPMLRPTIIFTTVISTIGGLQIMAEPLLFGGDYSPTGGSDRQFQTIALFMYEQGFREFRFGYASAIAWTLCLLIAIFAVANFLLTRRIATDEE
ncbi:ABC transporter permease [Actinoplanes sp. SE50]|uniref:carbohydrate ABC transporter permease n=1 Tax=unclassified Actinoplanes TaxID=2626549 RepID=UPI00023ECBA1|nr:MULTISPECIES: sugar ABC transporter permease [unclassified Actinoplanes]AEV86558.1 sn-glycerol-3-phosphate transport system permease protein ugpA [Actinoplanes sp. SE50/110]ATO84956.1 ABC transporter permease [Actinoplanes sp. SE50]SLM02365.1 ABC transporter permease [Actinoplanes sp. SE50/110]